MCVSTGEFSMNSTSVNGMCEMDLTHFIYTWTVMMMMMNEQTCPFSLSIMLSG